jgi:hypothetical protein
LHRAVGSTFETEITLVGGAVQVRIRQDMHTRAVVPGKFSNCFSQRRGVGILGVKDHRKHRKGSSDFSRADLKGGRLGIEDNRQAVVLYGWERLLIKRVPRFDGHEISRHFEDARGQADGLLHMKKQSPRAHIAGLEKAQDFQAGVQTITRILLAGEWLEQSGEDSGKQQKTDASPTADFNHHHNLPGEVGELS